MGTYEILIKIVLKFRSLAENNPINLINKHEKIKSYYEEVGSDVFCGVVYKILDRLE